MRTLTRLIYTFDTFALSIVNDFPINSCHRAHKKVSSFRANKISVCNFLHPCFETLSSSHTDLLRGPDSINTRDNLTIHWPFAEALNLTKESIFFGINFPVPCTTHYRSRGPVGLTANPIPFSEGQVFSIALTTSCPVLMVNLKYIWKPNLKLSVSKPTLHLIKQSQVPWIRNREMGLLIAY